MKSINFPGEEYTLGEDTGKLGVMKTYQYTKSGNITGLNDYVQIFVINKNEETTGFLEPTKRTLAQMYNLTSARSADGEFGVFRMPGQQRDYFAYMIERDTPSAHWILTFVIQSNFSETPITTSEARGDISKKIASLESVYESVSY